MPAKGNFIKVEFFSALCIPNFTTKIIWWVLIKVVVEWISSQKEWNLILYYPSCLLSPHPSITRFLGKRRAAIQHWKSYQDTSWQIKRKIFCKSLLSKHCTSPFPYSIEALKKADNIFLYFNFGRKKT